MQQRLLIATPLYPPEIGGPATYAKLLEEELPKQGIAVELVKFGDVRHLPKGIAHLIYFINVLRAARGNDAILALDPVSVGFPALLAAIVRNKPLILRVVGDYAWEQGQQRYGVKEPLDEFIKSPDILFSFPVRFLRIIERFVARHAKQIIVPSNYLKGIVMSWGISEEKISLVYNAFDNSPLLPSREEVRKNIGVDGVILLSAGRLVPWKGFGALIALTAELREIYPNLKLFIAGSGPLEEEIRKKIIAANLAGTVILLGNVVHEKLMPYIRAANCFVLNTGYEGFSHLLLEVLAIGTPIVTTNVGGNPEIVEHEKTGLLVGYDDRDAFRFAIKRILDDHMLAETLIREGRHFVAGFTRERTALGTAAVIRSAVSRTL